MQIPNFAFIHSNMNIFVVVYNKVNKMVGFKNEPRDLLSNVNVAVQVRIWCIREYTSVSTN